jgi:hypothetical protein
LAPVANGGAFFETPFHYRGTKMLGRALVEAMTFNAIRYRTYFEDARKRAEQVADPVEKQAGGNVGIDARGAWRPGDVGAHWHDAGDLSRTVIANGSFMRCDDTFAKQRISPSRGRSLNPAAAFVLRSCPRTSQC